MCIESRSVVLSMRSKRQFFSRRLQTLEKKSQVEKKKEKRKEEEKYENEDDKKGLKLFANLENKIIYLL